MFSVNLTLISTVLIHALPL